MQSVHVTAKGAKRWALGHPWIFASDVVNGPASPGIVTVYDHRQKAIGLALFSPRSEIRLRLLERKIGTAVDEAWWHAKLAAALERRHGIDATAYRIVHGEGDGLPSLIVDRYDRYLVVQLLSAGLETERDHILAALHDILAPTGILLRNDQTVRAREGLSSEVELVFGSVPEDVLVREGAIKFFAAPWTGQKTGAFLDQRVNRVKAAGLVPTGGRALDCFSYHGSFALHLAAKAGEVIAVDSSPDALLRGQRNAAENDFTNITWVEADAFEALRDFARRRERFDLVVVDPPAFAKTKAAVPQALRGYKEINLQALRIVRAGGHLVSASCSFHVRWPQFLETLADAARDSGRKVTMVEHLTQPVDHPEDLAIPETGYLKGVIVRVD